MCDVILSITYKCTNKNSELTNDIFYSWLLDNCTYDVVELAETNKQAKYGISNEDAIELKLRDFPSWFKKHIDINLNGVKDGTTTTDD